jgi:hypothetical protein
VNAPRKPATRIDEHGRRQVAPPWVEADKEVRTLLGLRDGIVARAAARTGRSAHAERRDRSELEALVVEITAATARLNAGAPTDRQHRRPLSLAGELARLDAAAGDSAAHRG